MSLVYLGLGSNLNQPKQQVLQAIQALESLPYTQRLLTSSLYTSKAVGPTLESGAAQPDYINAVVAIETTLPPLKLLDQLQEIENQHHRTREIRWGPRTLDLDILLYDNQTIDHERLQVPHPQMHLRNFVLFPLAEIAPKLILPNGDKLESLLDLVNKDGLDKLSN